jgi:hypothetical protein
MVQSKYWMNNFVTSTLSEVEILESPSPFSQTPELTILVKEKNTIHDIICTFHMCNVLFTSK